MDLEDARSIIEGFLQPLDVDAFLDRTLQGGFGKIDARSAPSTTTGLLGPDPTAT